MAHPVVHCGLLALHRLLLLLRQRCCSRLSGRFSGALMLVVILPLAALPAFVARRTSEFAVTNKRVLIKTGLIRCHSLETLLSKIESIGVTQGILGRILDFGTIVVSGTGGSKEPFHRIADPLQFQCKVQEQIVEDWRSMLLRT